jgi:DNA-binding SARP family transcriptional activator
MTAFRPGGRLPELRFGILGPVRIEAHGHSVDAGPRKQQIVLAALLCNANSLVSVDALTEALWLGSPPRTARKNIQVYVSALRGMTRADPGPSVSYQTGGYVLHASPAELDSLLFEQLARDASRLRHVKPPAAMAEALAGALKLWRGRALDGMRDVPLLDAAAERLDRQFLAALEDWAEAEIATGSGAGVIERVTEAAQQHPLRERLRTLQMTALCQAGRQTEALAVYDELRRALAHQLGLSPSPALEEFYRSVLQGLVPAAPRPAAPRSAGRAPSRLPWDQPTFTGRTEITRQLTAALVRDGHRQVVVTGPLGVGKTALAVHAAHQLDDDFPDGRFFVRLHDADGTARPVEEVVAQLMPPDLVPMAQPGPRVRRGQRVWPGAHHAWQLWLARHRALIILDGARRESDVLPLLPETGDSAVIVTARCRLAGLEAAHRLLVPPFSMPEALDFLRRMISAGRVAADVRSAERIVLATGLLPLGLRVVAERLALLHHVPLREYADRMAGASYLLDELSAGDVTIRPRLARAIGELPQPARWGVTRLGRLSGAVFMLSEAAAVLDADERTAMRVLETLLEASVITVPSAEMFAHAVRYEMPPLIYAYAREVAAADALEVAAEQNGVPSAR